MPYPASSSGVVRSQVLDQQTAQDLRGNGASSLMAPRSRPGWVSQSRIVDHFTVQIHDQLGHHGAFRWRWETNVPSFPRSTGCQGCSEPGRPTLWMSGTFGPSGPGYRPRSLLPGAECARAPACVPHLFGGKGYVEGGDPTPSCECNEICAMRPRSCRHCGSLRLLQMPRGHGTRSCGIAGAIARVIYTSRAWEIGAFHRTLCIED